MAVLVLLLMPFLTFEAMRKAGLLKHFFNFTRMLGERSSVSPNNIPYAVMKFYAVTPLRDGTAVTAPCVNFPSSISHS